MYIEERGIFSSKRRKSRVEKAWDCLFFEDNTLKPLVFMEFFFGSKFA